MASLDAFPALLRRPCMNQLHTAGQTTISGKLFISGRKWKLCHTPESVWLVRSWNQMSRSGQQGIRPNEFHKGMSIRAPSFHVLALWDVFVELWESRLTSRILPKNVGGA